MNRRAKEKAFLERALWIVIKAWMKSRTRLKKLALTFDERIRLQIKDSLRSAESCMVDVIKDRAEQ